MTERIVIEASEGMFLTNGAIYAKRIELGDWDSPENYYEITEEEYDKLTVIENDDLLIN